MLLKIPMFSLTSKERTDPDQEFVTLHPRAAEMIWVPDIFIDQAVSLRRPRYLTPAASLRVYRDGLIRLVLNILV